MMSPLSLDERVELVCHGLDETESNDPTKKETWKKNLTKKKETIKKIMAKRPLRIYWGTAPTGAPHIGYFVPVLKIADFLRAGCQVTILLADLHASLDALKSTFDLVESRTNYYEAIITAMLQAVGVSTKQLKFVRGSDFQLRPDFTLDLYKLMAMTSFRHASKAGAEVVKQAVANNDGGAPTCLLSGVVYPLLQALDEVYLDVDVQFGGFDQLKIFMYAEEFLKKLDPNKKKPKGTGNGRTYHKRIHLCNPMVPSLGGGKMSSSGKAKISILAPPEEVERVVRKAFCVDKQVEENGLLAFCEFVLIPWRQDLGKPSEPVFKIPTQEGSMAFTSFQDLKEAFVDGKVTPQLLKKGVTVALNQLLEPIQSDTARLQELIQLHDTAYPESPIIRRSKWSLTPAPSGLEKFAASSSRSGADKNQSNQSWKTFGVAAGAFGLLGFVAGFALALTRRSRFNN